LSDGQITCQSKQQSLVGCDTLFYTRVSQRLLAAAVTDFV